MNIKPDKEFKNVGISFFYLGEFFNLKGKKYDSTSANRYRRRL